jgi:predicted small secreted protein
VRDRSFVLPNLRARLVGLLLVLLPIVLAACNNNNGSGPGY